MKKQIPSISPSAAAQAHANGDLSARVEASNADELGDLGVSINSVAGQLETQAEALKKARDEMELRVQERTAELEQVIGQLQASEERARRIIETALDAIVTMDGAGFVIGWNPQAETIFGWTSQEALGRLLSDTIIPDRYREAYQRGLAHSLSTGKAVVLSRRIEITALHRDGHEFPIELAIAPIQFGGTVTFSAFVRDITERKQAEELLRASLKEVNELKTALDEHAIVAITDPQGKIIFVNDKFCTISKYSREELIGQDHRIINSGFHPKEFIRDLWTTIAHGRVWHGEIKNRAKDGSFYWVETTIVPFLNEQGKPRQYVAIRADITERKQAEGALKKARDEMELRVQERTAELEQASGNLQASEERTRRIIETALDAVVTMDGAGLVIGWNSQAETIFGWTSQEVLGRLLSDTIIPNRYREAHQRGMAHYLSTGKAVVLNRRFEITALHRDGHEFPIELAITPIQIGGTVTFSAFVRDITERKQTEEEILQLNSQLEKRVAERTAKLEAANKELEAFSYSVSHDLRSPLRAVDGFSQAVLEDYAALLPAEGQRYLLTIREGAQKMGALIDDLLTFSRLSRQPLNHQEINTGSLVRSILDDLRSQETDRQIDLRIGDLPPCQGDPALLRQVWINLLSNALKYTRKRDLAVVEIGCEASPEGNVYFVRDNGSGFDMCYADKLFGVFQRLHRAEDYEGTGVGLAIVQRIIHRHGGHVWAEAAVDHGATFYFTLEGTDPTIDPNT